jgi:hypothetical protein
MMYVDEMPVRGRSEPIKIWSLEIEAVLKENWQSEVAQKEPVPSAPSVAVT